MWATALILDFSCEQREQYEDSGRGIVNITPDIGRVESYFQLLRPGEYGSTSVGDDYGSLSFL